MGSKHRRIGVFVDRAMWRKQRKYCSIARPFRRDHRPEADLCALERTPLDSRDAPNYSNHQRSRMKGPLLLSLLVAGLLCSCTATDNSTRTEPNTQSQNTTAGASAATATS